MRHLIFWICLSLFYGTGSLFSQVVSLNVVGDTILIYPDGTLAERRRSVDDPRSRNMPELMISNRTGGIRDEFEESRAPRPFLNKGNFPTNPLPFTRPDLANLYLPSPSDDYRVWFNVNEWIPQPTDPANPQTEMVFQLRQAPLLAMLIYEPQAIDLQTLVHATITNLEQFADNVRLVAQEYRDVNERFLLCVRLDGSYQGESFTYYNYYHSDQGYTVQFTLYAPRTSFLQYQRSIRDLMNGLVVR